MSCKKNISKKKKKIGKFLYKFDDLEIATVKNDINWDENISLIKQKLIKKIGLIDTFEKDSWLSLHNNLFQNGIKCIMECYFCKKNKIKELNDILTKKQVKDIEFRMKKKNSWKLIKSDIKYPKEPVENVVVKNFKECFFCKIITVEDKRCVDNIYSCNSCSNLFHLWELAHGKYNINTKCIYYSNLICLQCFCKNWDINENIRVVDLWDTFDFFVIYILFKIGYFIIADSKYKKVYKVTTEQLLAFEGNYSWVKCAKGIYIYLLVNVEIPKCTNIYRFTTLL